MVVFTHQILKVYLALLLVVLCVEQVIVCSSWILMIMFFCGKHDKVKICHKQGGHKSTYKLQEIKQKDLPKHRAHGDLDPIIYYKADASGCGIASDVCLGCTDTPPKGCARLC